MLDGIDAGWFTPDFTYSPEGAWTAGGFTVTKHGGALGVPDVGTAITLRRVIAAHNLRQATKVSRIVRGVSPDRLPADLYLGCNVTVTPWVTATTVGTVPMLIVNGTVEVIGQEDVDRAKELTAIRGRGGGEEADMVLDTVEAAEALNRWLVGATPMSVNERDVGWCLPDSADLQPGMRIIEATVPDLAHRSPPVTADRPLRHMPALTLQSVTPAGPGEITLQFAEGPQVTMWNFHSVAIVTDGMADTDGTAAGFPLPSPRRDATGSVAAEPPGTLWLIRAVETLAPTHPALPSLRRLVEDTHTSSDPNVFHDLSDAIAVATGYPFIHRDENPASGIEDADGRYVQWFLDGLHAHVEIGGADPADVARLGHVASELEWGWRLHGVAGHDIAGLIPPMLGRGPYRLFPETLTSADVTAARAATPPSAPPTSGPPVGDLADGGVWPSPILDVIGDPRTLAALDAGQITVGPDRAEEPAWRGRRLGRPNVVYAVRVPTGAAAIAARRAIAAHNLQGEPPIGVIIGGIGPIPLGDGPPITAGVTVRPGTAPMVRAENGDGYWVVDQAMQDRSRAPRQEGDAGWSAQVLAAVRAAEVIHTFLRTATLMDLDESGVNWQYAAGQGVARSRLVAATVPGVADRVAPIGDGDVLADLDTVDVIGASEDRTTVVLHLADGSRVHVPAYQTVAVVS